MVKEALLYTGLSLFRKRGRPSKNLPAIDQGTLELQQKRHAIDLHELQLAGTVASCLVKDQKLSMEDLEALQKIYILRRRYLTLINSNVDGKSYFPQAQNLRQKHFMASEQRENLQLENTWREVHRQVQQKNKNFLPFLDHLFTLRPYENVREIYQHFCKSYRSSNIRAMANLANEIWQR